jgi:hypothetical protein
MAKDCVVYIEEMSTIVSENNDFARDLLTLLRESAGVILEPNQVLNCDFHYHGKDEPCY